MNKKVKNLTFIYKIENILSNKPGGERILNEYAQTKSRKDSRRCDMVKILVAHTHVHIYISEQREKRASHVQRGRGGEKTLTIAAVYGHYGHTLKS